MHLGQFVIDQVIVFAVNTHDPDPAGNGDAIDADSAPTYRVYEQETGTPILTGSMAKLDDANTLGFYSKALTLSAANGLEVDKCYTIRVLAVVGTVEQVKLFTFNIVADVAGDIPAIVVVTFTGAQTAGPGVLRAISGDGETELFDNADEALWGGSGAAIGDLDGDGEPEIVALAVGGVVKAFTRTGALKWKSAAYPADFAASLPRA